MSIGGEMVRRMIEKQQEEEKRTTYKITTTHKVTEVCEFSVDWNGFNFLIIYGKHKNGWFIAIPNWNVCVESAEPENDRHNTTVLARARFHDEAPAYLAKAIHEHWEANKCLQ